MADLRCAEEAAKRKNVGTKNVKFSSDVSVFGLGQTIETSIMKGYFSFKVVLTLWTLIKVSEQQEEEDQQGTIFLGSFKSHQHAVSGDLYREDNASLLVENFGYDGSGPDVFFTVGTAGRPSEQGRELFYAGNVSSKPLKEYQDASCKLKK